MVQMRFCDLLPEPQKYLQPMSLCGYFLLSVMNFDDSPKGYSTHHLSFCNRKDDLFDQCLSVPPSQRHPDRTVGVKLSKY